LFQVNKLNHALPTQATQDRRYPQAPGGEAPEHPDRRIPVGDAEGGDRTDQGGLSARRPTRNRDLDPQLVWRGKDQQGWSDIVVNAPPLYIQEKVKPKILIDLLKRSQAGEQAQVGRVCRRSRTTSRSARCTSPRAWSSGPSR
jgi:hypothetical protein